MTIHRTVSQEFPIGDPRRFNFGTVSEVESTMERVFTVPPSAHQILTDIMRLPRVVEQIIAHDGAIVQVFNFRSGHRAERHDMKSALQNPLKKSHRKATYELPPCFRGDRSSTGTCKESGGRS